MARFARCAEVLTMVNAAMIALFMFGPGLAMPPATSVSPPSVCIAQAPVYHAIGRLQASIVGPLVSSVLLCALVMVEVPVTGGAGDSTAVVTGMHLIARRFLRGCMVLALLLAAVSIALGMRIYGYVLEAKVTVFSCLPVGVRFSFISSYAMATIVCAYVFARFFWVVLFYD